LNSLVYKCDIAVLGGLLVLVALLDIVMNPIAGYLQDQEFLDSKGFPVKTWGRRASWFVTHFPLTLLVLAAILLPPQSPSSDPTAVTYLWFFFVSIVAKWVHTVNTVAINAAGDEIYPSQAERTQLFGYRVAIIVIAVLVAVVCTQSIIGDADNSPDRCCAAEFEGNLPKTCIVSTSINSTNTTYIIDINLKSDVSTSVVMVIVLTVLSFLGLLGVKPLMFAKQPVKEGARDRKQGLFKGLHEFLYWKPFVCLFCAEFFDKVAGQTLTAIVCF
jgi:Na+/melibiose symporter-like transporter